MGKKYDSEKKQANENIHKGRPPITKEKNQPSPVDVSSMCEYQGNPDQITNFKFSVKLMKILTLAGQVRFQTITGHKKALKDIISKVEQISLKLFYFLAQKAKAKLTIQDGKLYDQATYVQIDKNSYKIQYHNLIDKINLVCKELDDDFIKELKQIIEIFIKFRYEHLDEQELIFKIMEYIHSNEENFKYILEWYHTKVQIYKEQLNFNKKQLEVELESNKYKHSHGRPKEKKEKTIRNKIQKLDREINCDPLLYLISRLVKVFLNELQNINEPPSDSEIEEDDESKYINQSQDFLSFSEYQIRFFK